MVNPSDAVQSVLELAGLGVLLASGAAGGAASGVPAAVRTMDHAGARFDVYDVAPAATLRCRVVGDPAPLARADFAASAVSASGLSRDDLRARTRRLR